MLAGPGVRSSQLVTVPVEGASSRSWSIRSMGRFLGPRLDYTPPRASIGLRLRYKHVTHWLCPLPLKLKPDPERHAVVELGQMKLYRLSSP